MLTAVVFLVGWLLALILGYLCGRYQQYRDGFIEGFAAGQNRERLRILRSSWRIETDQEAVRELVNAQGKN